MPVPSTIADLSATESSNSPAGSEPIGIALDNYIRAHAAIIRQVSDAKTSASDLSASGGSSLVGFLQAGTGATARTVQSKLRDVVSVNDFGADPTGAADSYASITAAIAATPDGGRLEMNGTFATSAKIVIDPYRVQIVGNPTFVPYGSYSDYLVEFGTNGANDPVVPDLGNKINVQSITIDGQLKSRGVSFVQVYNAAMFDISVFRAYGTSVRMEGCMEDSFHGMLISGGKQRAASWLGTETVWNSGTAYTVGQVVYIEYAAYSGATAYAAGDFVTSGGEAWRAKQATTGNAPGVTSAYWEWVPFEYFKCLIANTNKDPHSASPLYTTRSTTTGDRYWRQVFPYEAALDLNNESHAYPNNNLNFYGMFMRHCSNTPLVRIDSNYASTSLTDINFFGGQVHQLLAEYITAYDARYPTAPCGMSVPTRGLLLEVGAVIDFNIFGGNWRCGEADNCKSMQIGWKNPGKASQGIGLIGVSFNGDGNNMVGISSMPSFSGVGVKVDDLLFRFVGTNNNDVIDPLIAIRHKSRLGANYNDRVIINENTNPSMTLGKFGEANTPSIPLLSSGLSAFDARARAAAGTATAGTGEFDVDAQYFRVLYAALYEAFRVQGVNNGANYVTAQGNIAGSPPILKADGSDTNIDLLLRAKGTGVMRFGTLTASADAPITGYITIKDDAGATRKLAVIS